MRLIRLLNSKDQISIKHANNSHPSSNFRRLPERSKTTKVKTWPALSSQTVQLNCFQKRIDRDIFLEGPTFYFDDFFWHFSIPEPSQPFVKPSRYYHDFFVELLTFVDCPSSLCFQLNSFLNISWNIHLKYISKHKRLSSKNLAQHSNDMRIFKYQLSSKFRM